MLLRIFLHRTDPKEPNQTIGRTSFLRIQMKVQSRQENQAFRVGMK